MSDRSPLPDRRAGLTFDVGHLGRTFSATLGFYDGGELAEIFLTSKPLVGELEMAANLFAYECSQALQRGQSIASILEALPSDTYDLRGLLEKIVAHFPECDSARREASR